MKFSKNPFTLFYIVFAYIVTFSIWWAYLLYNKNETAFNEKIEINKIYFNSKQHAEEYTKTSEFLDLKQKYERQRSMIIMEGTVFILLLIGGLMIVKRVLTKELRLADLQRNFMLSITHELKSPLAAIKLNMQTVKGRDLEKEKSNKLIENSLSDVNRLETLIENILFASKLESDQNLHNKEELNLTETLHILIERFNKNAKKITIESQLEQDIYYHIDPIGFVSIVTNLIDNAIKYSDQNTVIKILLEKAENAVVLKVIDQGIGIPDNEKEAIFEKFYRVGDEKTRKSKGTGLGLYIVKKFVEMNNGNISVNDNTDGGSIMTVILP